MRDIIKKELSKITLADMSHFDAATNTYYIPKYSKPTYDVGKCYIVDLADEIINNSQHVLASNWNSGNSPKVKTLKIYINKSMGKMILTDGVEFNKESGTDGTYMFSGWLDINYLTQLAVL